MSSLSENAPNPATNKDQENDVSDVLSERMIADEYKIWKKNTPFLYDIVMTTALEWPSLTVEWAPVSADAATNANANDSLTTEHQLLLGTHTAKDEQNFVMLANISLPKASTTLDARKYDDSNAEIGGFGHVGSKVTIKMKIKHHGEVNRARYCPQNNFLVATKGPASDVYIFDVSKHSSFVDEKAPFNPQFRLTGLEGEGYGLAWNPLREGQILSCGQDNSFCLWDIKGLKSNSNTCVNVAVDTRYIGHTDVVEDVAWHNFQSNVFGSVADDKSLLIWDARPNKPNPTSSVMNAHKSDINGLSFSPVNEFLLATAGSDNIVSVWDLRNLTKPVTNLIGHTDDVLSVNWHPTVESVLCSSSADRRVNIWDLSLVGKEQDEEDAADGPPELLFIHGGHTSKINDFSFIPNVSKEEDGEPSYGGWTIASVAEDNVLQVWEVAEDIVNGEDDEEEAGEGDVDDGDLEN